MGNAQFHGRLWGAAAADWVEYMEWMARPLWDGMLRSANVKRGERLLDAGCGGGGASVLAAEHGARVTGVDGSEALLEVARSRVPDATFDLGELEELPYDDDSFDVAFCSLALMFPERPEVALQELIRVTTDDGRIVIGIWGTRQQCELGEVGDILKRVLPKPPPSDKIPFGLSGPGVLESLCKDAGLQVAEDREVECPYEYADKDAFWRAIRTAGPVQGGIMQIGEDAVRAEMMKLADKHEMADGSVRLKNVFRYVLATR